MYLQSLHRHALGEISRLIYIQSFCHAYVISEQLQRNHCQASGKVLIDSRHIYGKIHCLFNLIFPISCQAQQICATASALNHNMEINVISGALYTQDGKKIADVKDSSIMLVDELYKQRTMEVAENIGKTHSITCQLAPYDMRMVYSLMYGMKITNNFLKMHGGIMVRNAARRKYRRK